MRYEDFAMACKRNKNSGIKPVGKIDEFNGQFCIVNIYGNRTMMLIKNLVDNIVYDFSGTVTNPSKIKNWTGWDK